MNKRVLALVSALLLASCAGGGSSSETSKPETNTCQCVFLKNYNKEKIDLSSGFEAVGNSLVYVAYEVKAGDKIEKPAADPTREKYEFQGWYQEETCKNEWNFENAISSNVFIYAKWGKAQGEEFVEPEYVAPSNIDDSISGLIEISGVFNEPISSGVVSLTNASINKLIAAKGDVTEFLNFKKKTDVTVVSAYAGNIISISACLGEASQSESITVKNVTADKAVSNSVYESKAQAYEEKSASILDHRIMLAGSSSMENWKTSTEDLKPLTTYNHGIGGTTVEMWGECLNARLVYPHSPKTVVYYVGINNVINSHHSASQIETYLEQMFVDVHEHLPNTKVYYVLMNHVPGYMEYVDTIDAVNEWVLTYEKTVTYLTTIDPGAALLKESGLPNDAYFLTDGLHMSLYGYVIWGGIIKAKLISDMKAAQ